MGARLGSKGMLAVAGLAGLLAGCTGVDGTGYPYGTAYLPPPASMPGYAVPQAYRQAGKPMGYALPEGPAPRAPAAQRRQAAPAVVEHGFGTPTRVPGGSSGGSVSRVNDHGFLD